MYQLKVKSRPLNVVVFFNSGKRLKCGKGVSSMYDYLQRRKQYHRLTLLDWPGVLSCSVA